MADINRATLRLHGASCDMLRALVRALADTESGEHVAGCVDNPTERPCCWVAEARHAVSAAGTPEWVQRFTRGAP